MAIPHIPVHEACGSRAAVTWLAYAATADHVTDVYACASCGQTFQVRNDDPDDERRLPNLWPSPSKSKPPKKGEASAQHGLDARRPGR